MSRKSRIIVGTVAVLAVVGGIGNAVSPKKATPAAAAATTAAASTPAYTAPVDTTPAYTAPVCAAIACIGDWSVLTYKLSRDDAGIAHVAAAIRYDGANMAGGSKCFNVSLDKGSVQVGSGFGCVNSVAPGSIATADIVVWNAPTKAFKANVRFTSTF